jgi:hypothetical protein
MQFAGTDCTYFTRGVRANLVPSDPRPKAIVISDGAWDGLLADARKECPGAIDLLHYTILIDGMAWMPLRAIPDPPPHVRERASTGWAAVLY